MAAKPEHPNRFFGVEKPLCLGVPFDLSPYNGHIHPHTSLHGYILYMCFHVVRAP